MDLVARAVGSLLPKLLQVLEREYKLQTGLKKNMESLSEELKHIHAFLHKVSEVPWDQLDEPVKEWASEIREASYDMEDILDTYLVRIEGCDDCEPAGRSRLKHAMNKMANVFSFSKGKARHSVGTSIQSMMKRLQEVADRRARYKINDLLVNSSATTSTSDPRLKAMYNEVANLVGINESSKDLISKLSAGQGGDMTRRKKTVSIFGIGGLGKTTLAKAVFDKLRPHFECGAFVPVGRNPILTKVLEDILYELDKTKYEDIHTKKRDKRQLIDNLREFLVNKRYLIVIDDIWENKCWNEAIELALLENNCDSRIIITTRNSQVAHAMGGEVYKIQPLSDDNSRKLFYARIYGDEMRSIEYQLDETTNKILKKCAGIPLAIITMASLLVGKPKEIWCDVITSIGFGHEVNEQVENTKKILSYSYYDMPSYLRTCLLYLSVFPEDHTISKTFLIWRWIAEGLIQGKPGICLFKLGEQCFNDLINRSMVQGVESEYDGLVRSCHVHDMVLDLIRSISTQENFVTILDNGDESSVSPPPSGGARRLALHANAMVHTAHQGKMMKMTQVRSFITISCSFGNQVPLSSFKVLRVLDMCDCEDLKPSYLVHLDNLVHLRYLRLDSTSIDDLPNEIGALKHLQTLILCDTEIRKLTPSISQLTQLVCLNCDYLGTLAPNWIGKLTSLEELEVSIYFTNKDEEDHARGFLKELGSLKELRVFRSRLYKMDTSMQIDLALSLSKLHKLQKLDLWCSSFERFYNAIWGQAGFVLSQHLQVLTLRSFMFPCMPSCISAACLPNLISLHLEVDTDEKGLEFLGRLPELCHLYLATDSTVTISNFSAHSYFRKLRFFYLPVSMIQFQLKEEDSTVSFHIWNGTNAMPFGSSKKDSNVAPYAVMPSLEKLFSRIDVRALKDVKGYFSNIGLEYLPSLRKVEVEINVSADDVEVAEAEAALTKTTEVHPNHPTLKVHK